MISNHVTFSVDFVSQPSPMVDVWDTVVSFLKVEKCLSESIQLSQIAGHSDGLKSDRYFKGSSEDIRRIIIERDLNGFLVITGKSGRWLTIKLLPRPTPEEPVALFASIERQAKSPSRWNRLIEGLQVQWPSIVARQWNIQYSSWQSTVSADSYEVFYGSFPPEIKRYAVPSDGIGPAREMIDPSLNPGRTKLLMPGVYFSANAEIWLGPHFWNIAPCTKKEVLAADFFLEIRDTPNFLYLKSWPHPFTRPDGEQGRVQQKLWKLLFHEDCEWPPGSGGISDEAIYGPPELMPEHVVPPVPESPVSFPPSLPTMLHDPMGDIDPLLKNAAANGSVLKDPWALIPSEPSWRTFDNGSPLSLQLPDDFEAWHGESWCDRLDDLSKSNEPFNVFAASLAEAFRELALHFSVKLDWSTDDFPLAEELLTRFSESNSPERTPTRIENFAILASSYFGECILREGDAEWKLLAGGNVRTPRIRWSNSANCFPGMVTEAWMKTGRNMEKLGDTLLRESSRVF